MKKYYTRACNFAYGKSSIELVKKKKNIPLNGNKKKKKKKIKIKKKKKKKIIKLKKKKK